MSRGRRLREFNLMLRDNHTEYDRNKTRGVPQATARLSVARYRLLRPVWAPSWSCSTKGALSISATTCDNNTASRCANGYPPIRLTRKPCVGSSKPLSAAEIDLAAGVLTEADQQRDRLLIARQQEVERLRYQTRLAERQYQHTDPENRLVAAELERRWEQSLQARDLQVARKSDWSKKHAMLPAGRFPPTCLICCATWDHICRTCGINACWQPRRRSDGCRMRRVFGGWFWCASDVLGRCVFACIRVRPPRHRESVARRFVPVPTTAPAPRPRAVRT